MGEKTVKERGKKKKKPKQDPKKNKKKPEQHQQRTTKTKKEYRRGQDKVAAERAWAEKGARGEGHTTGTRDG